MLSREFEIISNSYLHLVASKDVLQYYKNAIIVLNIIERLHNKFVSDVIISILFSENTDTKVKSNRINFELV